MARPTGVTVFGILLIVFASCTLISVLFSTLIIFAASKLVSMDQMLASTGGSLVYLIITTVVSVLIGLVGLVSGITILMLKEWGRKLLLGLAIFVIVFGILNIIILKILGAPILWQLISFPIGLVFYGLIIWYFTQKDVKKAFLAKT